MFGICLKNGQQLAVSWGVTGSEPGKRFSYPSGIRLSGAGCLAKALALPLTPFVHTGLFFKLQIS